MYIKLEEVSDNNYPITIDTETISEGDVFETSCGSFLFLVRVGSEGYKIFNLNGFTNRFIDDVFPADTFPTTVFKVLDKRGYTVKRYIRSRQVTVKVKLEINN